MSTTLIVKSPVYLTNLTPETRTAQYLKTVLTRRQQQINKTTT